MIKQKVMSAEEGRILPPPNYSASEHGKYLFHELLEQLKAYRFNIPPHLTHEDLELLVQRTLVYAARSIFHQQRAAFTCTDPKSIQKADGLTAFFALLGSARLKAARKMLMKLITEVVTDCRHSCPIPLFQN